MEGGRKGRGGEKDSSVNAILSLSLCVAVHNETKCHIHFPDANRSTQGGEKSSQVSITGQAANVELARRKIRVSS